MCKSWEFVCGHEATLPCSWPKQNLTTTLKFKCPAQTPDKQVANSPCYECLCHDTHASVAGEAGDVKEMVERRRGAGDDNWGYSARGMVVCHDEAKSTIISAESCRYDRAGMWPWTDAETMQRARTFSGNGNIQNSKSETSKHQTKATEIINPVSKVNWPIVQEIWHSELTNSAYDNSVVVNANVHVNSTSHQFLGHQIDTINSRILQNQLVMAAFKAKPLYSSLTNSDNANYDPATDEDYIKNYHTNNYYYQPQSSESSASASPSSGDSSL